MVNTRTIVVIHYCGYHVTHPGFWYYSLGTLIRHGPRVDSHGSGTDDLIVLVECGKSAPEGQR